LIINALRTLYIPERGYNMDYDKKISNLWDYLLYEDIATEEELKLVTDINGYNEESLNSVLYSRTGYRSLEQIETLDDD